MLLKSHEAQSSSHVVEQALKIIFSRPSYPSYLMRCKAGRGCHYGTRDASRKRAGSFAKVVRFVHGRSQLFGVILQVAFQGTARPRCWKKKDARSRRAVWERNMWIV